MGFRAPSKMFRTVQDFFHTHLEDYVGVRADPGSARGYVTQHRVEYRPGLPLMDRIDPHEHSINRQKLLAHLLGDVVGINRRLGMNAKRRQLFEHAVKAIVLRGCGSPYLAIAAPDDCDPIGFYSGHITSPISSLAYRHPSTRLSRRRRAGSLPLPTAKTFVEGVGIRPADRLHEGVNVFAGLGAVIHVIGVLVHIEREDRLPTGECGRVVGSPSVDQTLIVGAPGQQYPAGTATFGLAHRDEFGAPAIHAAEVARDRLCERRSRPASS